MLAALARKGPPGSRPPLARARARWQDRDRFRVLPRRLCGLCRGRALPPAIAGFRDCAGALWQHSVLLIRCTSLWASSCSGAGCCPCAIALEDSVDALVFSARSPPYPESFLGVTP